MHFPYDHNLVDRARKLRRNLTPEERILWYDYLRTYQPRFQRQKMIDHYILDFYCSKARLAIELDGYQHLSTSAMEQDAHRSALLAKLGITVLRFANDQIRFHIQDVCNTIHAAVQDAIGKRQP